MTTSMAWNGRHLLASRPKSLRESDGASGATQAALAGKNSRVACGILSESWRIQAPHSTASGSLTRSRGQALTQNLKGEAGVKSCTVLPGICGSGHCPAKAALENSRTLGHLSTVETVVLPMARIERMYPQGWMNVFRAFMGRRSMHHIDSSGYPIRNQRRHAVSLICLTSNLYAKWSSHAPRRS